MVRIGIISLIHESNTFISKPTTLVDFEREVLKTGQALIDHWRPTVHEVGAFLHAVTEAGWEPVPIFSGWAMPCGSVTAEAYDTMLRMITDGLDEAGDLDGLLVAPHGAGVSEEHLDMDGHWLTVVRDKVGPDMPIMCTLDPHTNLSKRMVDTCNATVIYRTNPHIDQRAVGLSAADLLARTLRGEIKPTQAASFPRVAINIEKQLTSAPPCKPMYDYANEMLTRPGVLSNSIALGFAFSDVEEMGSAFVVVTDNDPDLAQQYADEMADYLWEHRRDFVATLISIDDALDDAQKAAKPVCLLEMGDNVGGGSPGDSTFLARAIHERKLPRTFVALYDPEAVKQAEAAGIGERVELRIGGKVDNLHGEPLDVAVTVKSMHDGEYAEEKVRHGGRNQGHMGPTAIVETDDGLTLQLTTYRNAPFSLEHIRCCGLDPAGFDMLVAKGVIAPLAAYEEVCRTFIRVNTRGVTSADMNSFEYKHRRQPLFPFEEMDGWR